MKKAKFFALLSGILFGISTPVSKIFLNSGVNPLYLASFTYLGAGSGLFLYNMFLNRSVKFQNPLDKKDLPYLITMVSADILAIIFLMLGLKYTNSANASLLSNFEIVATSAVAFLFFKEKISKKLFISVILIVLASIILTWEGINAFHFQTGSIMVLIAYCLWGLENNCTRMLSNKNTVEITIIKGVFAGLGSLVIAILHNANLPKIDYILAILITGFLCYGFSVNLYILAQRTLKAVLTASYFAFNPYFAIIFSLIILKEQLTINFYVALLIMIIAMVIIYKDNFKN